MSSRECGVAGITDDTSEGVGAQPGGALRAVAILDSPYSMATEP